MRVRSRPDERRRKKREDAPKHSHFPFWKAACAFGAERFLLTGKRGGSPFRHDSGRGIMIRAIVCPHVRWVGRPWVGISKTPGEPVNGLKPQACPRGFLRTVIQYKQQTLSKIQTTAIDGESVRRRGKATPHQFAVHAEGVHHE